MPPTLGFVQKKRKSRGKNATEKKASEKQAAENNASKKQAAEKNPTSNEIHNELFQFDLLSKYGPCIGLTRLERFNRAKKLGLEPPEWMLEYITQEEFKNNLFTLNRLDRP
jgi:hypothetical protein